MILSIWISAIVSSIGCAALAVYTLRFNRSSQASRLFAVYCFALVGWLIISTLSFETGSFIYTRLLMALVSFSLVVLFAFVQEFTGFCKTRLLTGLNLLAGLVVIVLMFTPYVFMPHTTPHPFGAPQPGVLIPVFTIWISVVVLASVGVLVYSSLKNEDPMKQVQSQYIALGVVLSLIIPWFCNFYLVTFHNTHEYYPVGMIAQTSLVFFAAYAMTRYRFLSVKVVFKKSLVYGLAVLAYFGFLAGCVFFAIMQNQVSGQIVVPVFLGFMSLVLLYLYNFYSRKVKKFLDGIFFREDMQFATIVEEGKRAFSSTHELETFILELTSRVQALVDAPVVELLVRQDFRRRYAAFYPSKSRTSVGFDESAAGEFISLTGVFLKEEVEHIVDTRQTLKMMKRMDARVYWCIADKDGPLAIAFIGGHKSDMPFQKSALSALSELEDTVLTKLPTLLYWQKTVENAKTSWQFQ